MRNRRIWAFRVLMFGFTFAFSLICAEIGFRWAGYSGRISTDGLFLAEDIQWTLEDWWPSEIKRQPMPSYKRMKALNIGTTGEIAIHDHVFQVRKPEGITRIIFIGDSGTYGTGVKEKETFVNKIRQKLDPNKFEVINAGVPGFAPSQSFQLLKKHLIILKPDIVIYTMFLANDVLDLLNEPFQDHWNRFIIRGPEFDWLENSATFNFFRLSLAKVRYFYSDKSGVHKNLPKVDENGIRLDPNSCTGRYRSYLKPLHPTLKLAWFFFERELRNIKDFLSTQKIGFSTFIMPTHTVVSGTYIYVNDGKTLSCLEESGLKYEPEKMDSNQPLHLMLDVCKKLQLTCINPAQKVIDSLGLEFYIPEDDHPTVEGHKVLSDVLWEQRASWLIDASHNSQK